MTSNPIPGPETDKVAPDLDACNREPIHVPGSIQPHGCLLACALPQWTIAAASANFKLHLGCEAATCLGQPLEAIVPRTVVHDLRNVLQASMVSGGAERLNDVRLGDTQARFDLSIHVAGALVIIEMVPRAVIESSTAEPVALVKSMIGRLNRAPNLDRFMQLAAQQIRALTGFDRVMVYRFLEDQSGQVVAEALRSGLEPFLGLRYPASDIPDQARALYRRQLLRLIPDVDYAAVPLVTHEGFDEPVDLSLAALRSVSPVHIEYLRNMGSRATMTISIINRGSLWGLFACHHESPRRIAAATCTAVELFGQIFSMQIEAREQAQDFDHAVRARETHDRLIAGMPLDASIFDNLARFVDQLKSLIPCDGLAVWSGQGLTALGAVPSAPCIEDLAAFLGRRAVLEPFATPSLGTLLPEAKAYAAEASGMLAIPLARTPTAYLMFFRKEALQTVRWGGDPNKPVDISERGLRIGPRKSFAAWCETVQGRSMPWRPGELQIAETLRVSLLDVILRRADLVETERRAARENQALLRAELNHRVKTILALIRSLVRQSRQGARTMDDFAQDLEHRVRALATAHDQLTRSGGKNAPLRRLIEAEARAFPHSADRVALAGPSVALDSHAYQTLALVFHEMMTNAAKYGALSRRAGRLVIGWSRTPDGGLEIEWQESEGPPVSLPERRGFGTVIMEESIPFELGGIARVDYRPDGVYGHFLIPAAHIADGTVETDAGPSGSPPLDLDLQRL